MEDKKKEILNKILRKKEKEIKNYEETIAEMQDLQRKNGNDGNLKKSQIL